MPGSPILSWYDWLIGSVLSVFFCLTLSLNALALHYTYTKLKKPSLKKVPHLLVGALSLSGLGIAVCLYPPYIASRFVGQLDYAAGLCEFIAFSILFFGTLTISMVVAMSLERLAAIVFPFCYKERMTFRKSVLALACLVLYSLAVAILPVVLQQVQLNISTGVCLYAVESHSANAQLVVFVICTHYVVSLVLMFAANSVVVYTVHQLDKNSLSDVYHDQKCKETPVKASSMSACLSFAKMVGIMSVCYAVCWTAILLRILLIFACDWHNDYFDKVALVLVAIDPLINHVVCLVTMVKYREGYARALGLLCTLLKPGEQGVWRSAMTRISSISRRSFSTRSSSTRASRRRSSYPTKQVPAGRMPNDIESDPKDFAEKCLAPSNTPDIERTAEGGAVREGPVESR